MKVSELGYIKIIDDGAPRFLALPETNILEGSTKIRPSNKNYEATYIMNLSKTFTLVYLGEQFVPRYNIMAYNGPAELALYEFVGLGNRNSIRVNHLIISDPHLIDFDIPVDDYSDWERVQDAERLEVFGP